MSNTVQQNASQLVKTASNHLAKHGKSSCSHQQESKDTSPHPFSQFDNSTLSSLISLLEELVDSLQDHIESIHHSPQQGTKGDDVIEGGNGNDHIRGRKGDDSLRGGNGNDSLYGGKGDDSLEGGNGADKLRGGKGDDSLKGGDGSDTLHGGRGDDFLTGQKGDDFLFGGAGDDTLGVAGLDAEWGFFGDDFMNAGKGDDTIAVGTGNNTLIGGKGFDTAIFEGRPIDYTFSVDDEGRLVATNTEHNKTSTLESIENFTFTGLEDKEFSANDLLDNKNLSNRKDFMLYGDPSLNRMVIMKLSTFELVQEFPIDGEKVYSADHITDEKAYIMPRGSDFIQVLHRNAEGIFVPGEKIDLSFHPRTGAKNKALGLELISGTDKPMFALVDTNSDKVVAEGGRNVVTEGSINNYDGENATGHAQWISDDQFLFGDRENHELALYRVSQDQEGQWTVDKTDSITSPSSIHTFFGKNEVSDGVHTVYASMEGDESAGVGNENASVAELRIEGDNLILGRQVGISAGTHHPGLHPDGKTMYVPTADGKVEIIDRESLSVIGSISAGKGAGHVVMIPERNIALIVNHNDTFMTAIDLTTHEKIKDFEVATDVPEYDQALQAHTGRVSPDKNYFYNFATDSGTFFRVDLDTLEVDKQIYVGGTPKQAAQPGELF